MVSGFAVHEVTFFPEMVNDSWYSSKQKCTLNMGIESLENSVFVKTKLKQLVCVSSGVCL